MKRVLVLTGFIIAAGLPAFAATPEQNVAKGFAVDKSYALQDLGSISTFNGNLGVTMPIGARYQVSSALSYQFVLTYGGNVWEYLAELKPGITTPEGEITEVTVEHAYPGNRVAGTNVLRNVNAGLGWNVTLGFFETGRTGPNGYIGPDGARHLFHAKVNEEDTVTPGVSYTRDGSHLRLTTVNGLRQIEFPDGTRHQFDPSTGRLVKMLDRFGNQVTVTYAAGPACAQDPTECAEDWTIDDGSRIHKVDMKRIPATDDANSYAFDVVKSITFAHGTTAATTYTFQYAPDGVSDSLLPVSRQLAARQDCMVAPYILAAVLHRVTLPDGSKYEITMDRGNAAVEPSNVKFAAVDGRSGAFTNQDCSGRPPIEVWNVPSVTGHLLKMKRPTGATTEWTYQTYAFPPYVSSFNDCAGVGVSNCRFAISGRSTVGVKERIDYSRTPVRQLSKTTYTQSNTDTQLTRITTVTTYDDLAESTPTVVSTSQHFYTTHFTFFDAKRPDYGLPYTDETIGLPATESTNPDSEGRFLSSKTYAGGTSGELLSYTFLKYAADPSHNADDASTDNRRIVSERTVHLGADGATITNEIIKDYSDYDGLGNFRTVRTRTGRNSSPAIDRTVTTSYNRPDPATSTAATYDSGTYPGSFVPFPPGDAWIPNTYSSQIASENNVNASGLLERRSMKALFLFDRSNGFLERRRTLKTIVSDVRAASSPVTDPPFTTPPVVAVHANDLVAEFAQTAGNMTSESYYGGDEQSVGTGSLATIGLTGPKFSMTHTYSAGALATSKYASTAFESADRTIDAVTGLPSKTTDPSGVETSYEYDWAGRLTFSAPAGSAATTYVFATPATGPSTVTIKQRNGSSKTSTVLTTAVVEYDDLGRVWREKRTMPSGTYSVRETLYNGRGLVKSVSEWAAEDVPADLDRKTTFTYDALGRVVIAKSPDGKETKTTYDGRRTVQRSSSVATSATGETEPVTTETNDDLGRLIRVEEPDGTLTDYTYDVRGKLASVTVNGAADQDPRTFTYDGRGFLTSETHPESGTTTYRYDARGHVTKRSAASNIFFTYDAAERLTGVDEGSLPLKVFTFDRPNTVTGTTTDRSMGKLDTAKRHNRGTPSGDLTVTETYSYENSAGRLSKKKTALSTGETFTESYSYTRLGAPNTVTYPTCLSNCGSFTGPERVIFHSYDNGLLTAVNGYGSIGYAPNGMVTSVTHQKASAGQSASTDTYTVDDATGMARPASITFAGFCNDLSVNTISDKVATVDTEASFSVPAAGATSYQLFRVSGTSTTLVDEATTATLSVLVTATAQYFVRVGNGSCTVDSNTFTITADTCPTPPSTITVSPSTVPRNGTGTATVPATSGATYEWSIQGGTITSPLPRGASITFEPGCDASSVTLTVKVTASCGTASAPTVKAVPAGPATTAAISVSGSATMNQGQSKTINVALTGTSGWTLSWSPTAPSCAATAASFTCTASPAGTTTYVLTATDANGCTAESNQLTITVVPPAPVGLTATAVTATSVQLAWSFSGSADLFEIQRRGAGGAFVADGTAGTTGALRAATANAAYLYRVRAVKGGTPSEWSNVDLATTVTFTDDPAAQGSLIRAQQIMELRTAVNAVRALWNNSLGPFAFTDATLTGIRATAAHVQEARDMLNQARTGLGFAGVAFTDPVLTGLPRKAVHINELRGGVR